jgi:hypothetical protein
MRATFHVIKWITRFIRGAENPVIEEKFMIVERLKGRSLQSDDSKAN